MRRTITFAIVIIAILYQPPVTDALMISFDDADAAPVNIVDAGPLRDEYAQYGVHFRGEDANSKDGGARIKDDATQWEGIDPHSGKNFLAFNNGAQYTGSSAGGRAKAPEFVFFDDLWETVSIYAANSNGNDHFILRAYDSGDKVVGEQGSKDSGKGEWVQLTLTWSAGIKKIELSRNDSGNSPFVADDLVLTTIISPEPATAMLLGLGLLAIGISIRRRR